MILPEEEEQLMNDAQRWQRLREALEIKTNPVLRLYEAYRTNKGTVLSNSQVSQLIHLPEFNELITKTIAGEPVGYDDDLRFGTFNIPTLRERYRKRKKVKET